MSSTSMRSISSSSAAPVGFDQTTERDLAYRQLQEGKQKELQAQADKVKGQEVALRELALANGRLKQENQELIQEKKDLSEFDTYLQTRYAGAVDMFLEARDQGRLVTRESLMKYLAIDME